MLIIGLRTEDADVSVVRLLKRPRIVLRVLQQVKNTRRRDLVRPTKTKTSVHTIYTFKLLLIPAMFEFEQQVRGRAVAGTYLLSTPVEKQRQKYEQTHNACGN